MAIIKEIDPAEFGKTLMILHGTAGLVFGFFTTIATFMGFSMPKRLGYSPLSSEDRLYSACHCFMVYRAILEGVLRLAYIIL